MNIQAEYQIYTVVSWLLAKWRKNLNCFKSLTVPKISLLLFKVKIVIYRSKINLLFLNLNIYYGGLSPSPGVQEDRDIENHKLCLPVDQKQYLG